MKINTIKFGDLQGSDLIVDAIYEGGKLGNASDEVISKLLRVQNSSGFRFLGSTKDFNLKYCVLYTSFEDKNWPDYLDPVTGQFIYYGDNHSSKDDIHNTPKKGNLVLRHSFECLHEGNRDSIPPFFVFSKVGKGRDVQFKGLAVPGYPSVAQTDDLVAVWKHSNGNRFQNYKAIFTILDIPCIKREWINDLIAGRDRLLNAPKAYRDWVLKGKYAPLMAEPTIRLRSKEEQIPSSKEDLEIIQTIYEYFENPYDFEICAIELFKLMDSNVISCDRTRLWVDGGRDAIGKYRIGTNRNGIEVEFALEAKRYQLDSAVGVKEVSRLISRLRHRQFGVFVTTSYIHRQAYQEIIDDSHPVIIISAIDILTLLKERGIATKAQIQQWLKNIKG